MVKLITAALTVQALKKKCVCAFGRMIISGYVTLQIDLR